MMMPAKPRFTFPREHTVLKIQKDGVFALDKPHGGGRRAHRAAYKATVENTDIWDVQFCPFQPLEAPPIFALISRRHIFIGQITYEDSVDKFPIRTCVVDPEDEVVHYCCTWAKDEYDDVVLCVGGNQGLVKIYNLAGDLVRTLRGHGASINSIATSPVDPHIIATGSADLTIRLWNISTSLSEDPLRAIIAGDSHTDDIISIDFHPSGNWLVSAGQDMIVALWAIPPLPRASSPSLSPSPLLQILSPQFITSEVHNGIIDCIRFWGNLLISRDSSPTSPILIWSIRSFPPSPVSSSITPASKIAPFSHEKDCFTRSAFTSPFPSTAGAQMWDRWCSLEVPENCGLQFYLRFSVFSDGPAAGVLGFCGVRGDVVFWDLGCLVEYREFYERLREAEREKDEAERNGDIWTPEDPRFPLGVCHPEWLTVDQPPQIPSSSSPGLNPNPSFISPFPPFETVSDRGLLPDRVDFLSKYYPADAVICWESRFDMSVRHRMLKPHHAVDVGSGGAGSEGRTVSVGRQVAWSPDGQWCAVGMAGNVVSFMKRE